MYKNLAINSIYGQNINQYTIEAVIKYCYLYTMRTEKKIDWRKIVGLVDAQIFDKIDVSNREGWRAGKQLAEQILRSLERWYALVYPNLVYETFCDLTIRKQVSDHFIECQVPIVQLAETVAVTFIRPDNPNLLQCWNDLSIRYTCTAIADELEQTEIIAIILGIGERGGLDIQTLTIGKDDLRSILDIMKQLTKSMYSGVTYPSIDSSCTSCPFMSKCKL